MPKVMMTDGPMSGRVLDILDPKEAAAVLDRGLGHMVPDEDEEQEAPSKSTRAKRVKDKRKAERAVPPTETPEG